jgi:hypothetical protein
MAALMDEFTKDEPVKKSNPMMSKMMGGLAQKHKPALKGMIGNAVAGRP